MPKLQIIGIKQTAEESNLRWLHLKVKMGEPWKFQLAELEACRAYVTVIDPDGVSKKRQLAWQTARGPSPESNKIQPGDVSLIPVFAKSSSVAKNLPGLNGLYTLMNQLVYITDSGGLINGNQVDPQSSIQTDSLSPNLYQVIFELKKGQRKINKGVNVFYLVVPSLPQDLDGFVMYPAWKYEK